MKRVTLAAMRLAAAFVAAWLPALALAEEPTPEGTGRVVAATASSTAIPEDRYGVAHLFDLDDATTWCAREKVHVQVTVRLDRPTTIDTLHVTLGTPLAWRANPRVKQVFVTVLQDGQTMKKIRHKWPDRDEPREGRVNVGARGDTIIFDIDQVYGGSSMSGMCVAGVRLVGGPDGGQTIDGGNLAATVWGEEPMTRAVQREFTVYRDTADGEAAATLELAKRGKLEYRDDALGLKLEGKWRLEAGPDGQGMQLVFDVGKAKLGGKRLKIPEALERLVVPWRFAPLAEGEAATFVPWIAFGVADGALVAAPPRSVAPR